MNALDGDGYSPMQRAIKSKNAKIINYFLQNGADLDAKNIGGDNALEMAWKIKNQQTIKMFLQYQCNKY